MKALFFLHHASKYKSALYGQPAVEKVKFRGGCCRHMNPPSPPPATECYKSTQYLSFFVLPFAALVSRLPRLYRMLSRRGDSSPSRSSSADVATAEGAYRSGTRRNRGDGDSSREARGEGSVAAALSLPPLVGSGGGGAGPRRRKARHVSAFRERILEERRARKEVGRCPHR